MAGPGTKTAQPASLSRLPLPAKIGVGAGLAILVGVAYFAMGFSDVASQIANEKKTEDSLRSQLATAKEGEQAYMRDFAELNEKQQRQRELNKILPETAETPAFLSALQGVANVSGVSLNSWTPLEETRQQFFAKVPMKLTLSGRFHQIAKFFYGVGQLDRIINLENISISSPKRADDDVIVQSDALATAFHTLPATSASAAPANKPPTPAAPAKSGP